MKTKLTTIGIIFLSIFTMAQQYSVEFRVNMSIQETSGKFDPVADMVVVRGNFQVDAGDVADWSGTMFECTDSNGDKIFTATVNLPSAKTGTAYDFKYVIIKDGVDNWESIDNRTFELTNSSQVLDVVFFNDIKTVGKEINVEFVCNMEYETLTGSFNPANDWVSVRGDFNGWGEDDTLNQDPSNENLYKKTLLLYVSTGDYINYKFTYTTPTDTIWENDPNKDYTFTQNDYNNSFALISRYFNSIAPPPPLRDHKIKFTVSMDSAKSCLTGGPFAKVENVVLAGTVLPLKWPGDCWPDTEYNKLILLKDDGTSGDLIPNDNVWSCDILFDKYSPLQIQYKYGANFALPYSSLACNDNEFTNQEHFVFLSPDLISAATRDTFGIMGYKPLYDIVLVDVDAKIDKPLSFSLEQNFPNPFNPSTTIRYSISDAGFVSLKIYNLLGQEVVILVNEYKPVGTYTYQFRLAESINNSQLPSGIYFYQLKIDGYSSTKKMILLR
ncbi:MAG: T9SS type A sorting domain-containing protein [Ignavibacteriales bacterium]|nr:T9SS type A sorting domain-containing protein [Ignavibacteriales bacterium]